MFSSRELQWQSALDTVRMADGRKLHCTTFAPAAPRAVAVFAPATGMDVNVYVPLVVAIARTGVLLVLPLPDAGDDGRTAPALRHPEDLLALADATRRAHPHLPFFLGAHAAGCSLAWRALSERSGDVEGLFLIAPGSMGHKPARRIFCPQGARGVVAAAWNHCRDRWSAIRGVAGDGHSAPALLAEERQLPVFVAVPDTDHAARHASASALRSVLGHASHCTIVNVPAGSDVGALQPAAKAVPRWLASQRALQPSLAA